LSPALATTLRNIAAVARREFLWRGRTRTFKITTVLLVVVGVGLALAPVIIRFIDRGSTGDRIEVVVGDSKPAVDVPGALGLLLNAPIPGLPTDKNTTTAYKVEATGDVDAARARVLDGATSALLVLDRTAAGDLAFTLYSKDTFLSRTTQLVRQAASSIVIQDRLTRAGMLEVIGQDFIRTARAKGLREAVVVLRHALPGAILPVITYLGPASAAILTGSVVVETIFSIPGVGRYFVSGALNRDYTMVLGTVVFYSVFLLFFNLIVDILYAYLDPRIRYR